MGEKVKKLYQRLTFGVHKKMFLLNSLIGLAMMICLSISIYSIANHYLKNESIKYVATLTQQVNNSVDTYLEEMKKILLSISMNEQIDSFFQNNGKDMDKYGMIKGQLDFYNLTRYLMSTRKYNQFYVLSLDEKWEISTDANESTINFETYNMQNTSWFQKIERAKQNLVLLSDFCPIRQENKIPMFAYALKVQKFRGDNGLVLILSSNDSFFKDLVADTQYEKLDLLLIADENGEVIFKSNEDLYEHLNINQLLQRNKMFYQKPQNTYQSELAKDRYIVTVNTSSKTKWHVVSFVSEKQLQTYLRKMTLVVYVVVGAASMGLLIFSYYLARGLTRPIQKLSRLMKQAEAMNYMVKADIRNNDEIGQLSDSFNLMVKNVLENQVLRREAEIYALQQQINPHFLYNTLEAISVLAAKHSNYAIIEIVEKLGDVFRYSITQGSSEFVHISQELTHIKNYVDIQRIRFRDVFDVQYDLEDGILEKKVLKFFFQPIVENAIQHAFEGIDRRGLLIIKGYEWRGKIRVDFIDNGVGMKMEEIDRLIKYMNNDMGISMPDRKKRIGLKNVHSRLVMMYGEEYGVRISSEYGKGTQVTLLLPILS